MSIDPLTLPPPNGLTTTVGDAGAFDPLTPYYTGSDPELIEVFKDSVLVETIESPFCYHKRDDGTYTRSRSIIGKFRHSKGPITSKVVSRVVLPEVYVTGDPEDESLGGFTVTFYSSEDFTPTKVRLIEKKD